MFDCITPIAALYSFAFFSILFVIAFVRKTPRSTIPARDSNHQATRLGEKNNLYICDIPIKTLNHHKPNLAQTIPSSTSMTNAIESRIRFFCFGFRNSRAPRSTIMKKQLPDHHSQKEIAPLPSSTHRHERFSILARTIIQRPTPQSNAQKLPFFSILNAKTSKRRIEQIKISLPNPKLKNT